PAPVLRARSPVPRVLVRREPETAATLLNHVRPASRGCLVAMLLGAAVFAAGSARALDAQVSPPRAREGRVWADVRLGGVISSRIGESLSRGMPATLELHAELWRRRSAWFDRLESSFDAALKIRFEVWSRTYRIERQGVPAVSFDSLDAVRSFLPRPLPLPVGRI